jgi:hypothetical protein
MFLSPSKTENVIILLVAPSCAILAVRTLLASEMQGELMTSSIKCAMMLLQLMQLLMKNVHAEYTQTR